ncbi:MAG: DUF2807 domain-containing protein [Reichenbachiella sp.]
MKQVLSIITIPFLLFIQSCNDGSCVEGTGSPSEYEISVNDFSKISLIGIMDLKITQGNEQKVIIVAETEIFDELIYGVNNQHLKFDFDSDCINTDFGVEVRITVPDIRYISIEGNGGVTSSNDLSLDRLEIEVFGIGEVKLTGSANQIEYDVEGSLEVENFDFITASTYIDIEGSGDLEVSCTEILNIEVEGSANVAYKGEPQISQNVNGSLNLTNAN